MPMNPEFRPGDPVAIVPSRWTGRDGSARPAHGHFVGRHDEDCSDVDLDFGPYGQLRLPVHRKHLVADPPDVAATSPGDREPGRLP